MHQFLRRKPNSFFFKPSLLSISKSMMSTSNNKAQSISIADLSQHFNNFVISFDNFET